MNSLNTSERQTGGMQKFEDEAIVATLICPHQSGQVRFQGSWWRARSALNVLIPEGAIVRVIGRVNLTLMVEPIYST